MVFQPVTILPLTKSSLACAMQSCVTVKPQKIRTGRSGAPNSKRRIGNGRKNNRFGRLHSDSDMEKAGTIPLSSCSILVR